VLSRLQLGGWIVTVERLWADGDVVDAAAADDSVVVIRMRGAQRVEPGHGRGHVPDAIPWRPSQPWREVGTPAWRNAGHNASGSVRCGWRPVQKS
jgi:hypothetical protein